MRRYGRPDAAITLDSVAVWLGYEQEAVDGEARYPAYFNDLVSKLKQGALARGRLAIWDEEEPSLKRLIKAVRKETPVRVVERAVPLLWDDEFYRLICSIRESSQDEAGEVVLCAAIIMFFVIVRFGNLSGLAWGDVGLLDVRDKDGSCMSHRRRIRRTFSVVTSGCLDWSRDYLQ